MDARYIAVLEIGSSKVKGAVARVNTDGGATLVAAHEVKSVNSVRHGRVQNVQEVAARVDEVLRRLENNPAVAPRKLRRIRIAMGGRSVASVNAHAAITLPAEMEITAEAVERLKREAVLNLPADRRVVEVVPRSFVVDGAEVSNPIGIFGRNIQSDMTVVLSAPENLTNLERVRMASGDAEAAPLERVYVPRQLAVARMALTPSECQIGVALVDMGAETTTVSIHRNGVLQSLVTLPMGGRNITRDLATGLSVTEEQAEYIKTAQAAAIPDSALDGYSPEAREINSYAQARAGEIIANVLYRIEKAGFRTSDLRGGIVLTGRAAGMRRMADLFHTQTDMKVRIATADNSVTPGATGIEPVDGLDILALAAWPLALTDSDMTEKPAAPIIVDEPNDEPDEYKGYDSNRVADTMRTRRSSNIDDEDLLLDDPDDDDEVNHRRKPKKQRKPKPEPEELTDEIDDADDYSDGSRRGFFGRIADAVSKLGRGCVGEPGPDEIDE